MEESLSSNGVLPLSILQIGHGAFGVHLERHLQSRVQNLKVTTERDLSKSSLEMFEYIFLATNDASLKPLIRKLKSFKLNFKIVHFSGFHHFDEVTGLHPVASFNKVSSYDLNKILFVVDSFLDPNIKALFPNNQFIDPKHKRPYHNFLSVTANALQLLVHCIGQDFQDATGIESDVLKKIVLQSLEAEKKMGERSFSGPWVRGEKENQDLSVAQMSSQTLKNLNALFKEQIKIYHDVSRVAANSQIRRFDEHSKL